MNHLTRYDYAAALRLLAHLEIEAVDPERFARAAVSAVGSFVASELATLAVCDLHTGSRKVAGLPGPRVMAVPLFANDRTSASIVLSRRALDFSERDKERLELLRPHLAYLYRQACRAPRHAKKDVSSLPYRPPEPTPVQLTPREGDVMRWLSYGKTNTEIAALLAISPRTVHKHLEHIYVKLGVETRTAAVMRARTLAGAADRKSAATSGYRPGRGTSSPGIRPSRGSSLRGPAPTA